MAEIVCKKCGSTNPPRVERRGNIYANVCSDCGAWIARCKKEDAFPPQTPPEPEAAEEPGQPDCEFCHQDYVIPRVFDGGITAWDNIDHDYCPKCGKKVKP